MEKGKEELFYFVLGVKKDTFYIWVLFIFLSVSLPVFGIGGYLAKERKNHQTAIIGVTDFRRTIERQRSSI